MATSPGLSMVLSKTPKLFDAHGTCYLGITARGLLETILSEKLASVEQVAAWLNASLVEGRDYGPGTEQESANVIRRYLIALRGGEPTGDPIGTPIGTPTDPEPPVGFARSWEQACERAEVGLHMDGTVGCEDPEVDRRKEILAVGLPIEWQDFHPSVPRWAYLSNFVSTLHGTSTGSEFRDDLGQARTGEEIHSLQLSLRQRGPSGDGAAVETGPGVVA